MTKGQEWWRMPEGAVKNEVRKTLKKAKAFASGVLIPREEKEEEPNRERRKK